MKITEDVRKYARTSVKAKKRQTAASKRSREFVEKARKFIEGLK
jgi:hypothetical protein